jgi:hypothetical protein
MAVPKTAALPLGDAPTMGVYIIGQAPAGNPVLHVSEIGKISAGRRKSPLAALRPRRYKTGLPDENRCRSVAQSGSAPRSGRGGRRFESYHSDHFPAYRNITSANRVSESTGLTAAVFCAEKVAYGPTTLLLQLMLMFGSAHQLLEHYPNPVHDSMTPLPQLRLQNKAS